MAKIEKHQSISLAAIILIAVLLKVGLLILQSFPFNSDEAIVALMGRHILSGEWPIFFYGQAYMGSLDAYLVALFFWIFGQSVWVIRMVQTLLYASTILSTYFLAKMIFNSPKIGLISAALLAVPVINVTLYTTISLGGYGEALLIGNLILLLVVSIKREVDLLIGTKASQGDEKEDRFHVKIPLVKCLALGLMIGLGLWANGLTLVYSVPSIIYLVGIFVDKIYSAKRLSGKREFFTFAVSSVVFGFFVGAFPIWLFAVQHNLEMLVSEYFGSAVAVENGTWLMQVGQHLLNFCLLGIPVMLGFRPPWDVFWLALPLIPFVLFFWIWVCISLGRLLIKKNNYNGELLLLSGPVVFILLGFLGTSFGVDPSGRYFLPFAVILSIFAAYVMVVGLKRNAKLSFGLLGFVLIFNLSGTVQSVISFPHRLTTQFDSATIIDHSYDQQLIDFLEINHITRGYSNYWTAYPIAFLSNESLIFVPQLPYHDDFRYTSRDDRYAPYDSMVAASNEVAYITVNFPALDERIRDAFKKADATWNEKCIGDYRVFYDLSKPIRPPEINLLY